MTYRLSKISKFWGICIAFLYIISFMVTHHCLLNFQDNKIEVSDSHPQTLHNWLRKELERKVRPLESKVYLPVIRHQHLRDKHHSIVLSVFVLLALPALIWGQKLRSSKTENGLKEQFL